MVYHIDSSTHSELDDIITMVLIGTNELLIATKAGLVKFDVTKAQVIDVIPHNKKVKLMVSGTRYTAIGNSDASIDVLELKSERIIARFQMNCTTLSDIDLKDQTLVACGITTRHGTQRYDLWLTVYDLRSQSPLNPVAFPDGAAYVRLHPKLPSVALIASTKGLMHAVDIFSPSIPTLFTVDSQVLRYFEIASTGDYLCMVDNMSMLHLCCLDPEHSTMSNRVPIERPDPKASHRPISIEDEEFPLNSIGMPFYKETLLSAWPPQIIFKSAGRIPKCIDQSLTQSANIIDGVLVAPYDKDKYGYRNQVKPYISVSHLNDPSRKFLSTKNINSPVKGRNITEPEDVFQYKTTSSNSIPNAFKKMEILYSKFGIDDFDFDFYNKTKFSGLESHVDNSYTNSLLQLYRFVPEVFNFIIGNLAVENLEQDSLLTELGYLYDMLVKADGKHYRPTNFQHTLSANGDAARLELLTTDSGTKHTSPAGLAERLKRFNSLLLQKLAIDEQNENVGSQRFNIFPQIVGISAERAKRYYYSHEASVKQDRMLCLEVTSPVDNNPDAARELAKNPSIVKLIKLSMNRLSRQSVVNNGFQDIEETSFTVTSLPPVLSCNISLAAEDKKVIRTGKDWFKPAFYAACNERGFNLIDTPPRPHESKYYKEYKAVGFVCEIAGETDDDCHLVTFAQIPDNSSGVKSWYLFNDFLVMPIPEAEVFNMSYWWKTPLTVVYRRVSQSPIPFQYDAWKLGLNDEILFRDHFAAGTRETRRIEYELLTKEEAPRAGTLIAIDAEFVTLEAEQFEIKNNGVRSLLKPKKSALARVSVLRGDDGEKFGVPFIDDYVVVNDGIHDYLTSYSGIEHGDLDPSTSNKSLVTRQTVYRKLWLLLNLGCVFVGHGLTMDFRTINICVPKEQVRDTAVFFHKGQRILSLRFLAYILLNTKVQLGNHDSIEDAHTALMIYKRYLELQASGEFEDVLDQIFIEGQALKFRPPGEE
jgi:PAB-dependent poly(A)-specific ribonuclease subunit 2